MMRLTTEDMLDFGFRWIENTTVTLSDGSTPTIHPHAYRSSLETPDMTDAERMGLRLYHLTFPGEQHRDLIDATEFEVARALGLLPAVSS